MKEGRGKGYIKCVGVMLCIALLCMLNLKVRLKKTLSVLIALAISVLYAISDEVH